MKAFTFTVDDNIRVFRELTEMPRESLFDHPYLALYKRLHEEYDLKIQLNLFYEDEHFTLSDMSDRYKDEFQKNADWLKLSFHSRKENVKPYQNAGYREVFDDCESVQREIVRFAGEKSLAKTTTVHYCLATNEGLRALRDHGVIGLLGLYGSKEAPRSSYQSKTEEEAAIREGKIVYKNGIAYAALDLIVNQIPFEKISEALAPYLSRERIEIMIHEQYFYPDYKNYQADFKEKLDSTFQILKEHGYTSFFFEELICRYTTHCKGDPHESKRLF